MQRILKLVSVYEIIWGLLGLGLVVLGLAGTVAYEVVPVLWFGIFPVVSLAAGILLLLNWKYATTLSILVQFFQIPFIYIGGLMLNLGLPLNLTIKVGWNAPDGSPSTVLGINFLALGISIVLLCRRRRPLVTTNVDVGDDAPVE